VLLTHIIPLLGIEIPGFYYDPEKKRYFKITKDHPGKKLVLCHCGGWKDATTVNHNRVIPSNIKVTKVSIIIFLSVSSKSQYGRQGIVIKI